MKIIISYTIMSYTERDNIKINFKLEDNGDSITANIEHIYPSLYSLYDISTLQSIYGANTETNQGNNIYNFKYSDFKTQTIWDSGGEDTIDLSNTQGKSEIDLRGGTLR